MLDDQIEHQPVPNIFPQVYAIELHNILLSDPNDVGLKDSMDEDDNIIISDSTLRLLLPPKLNLISGR